MASLDALWQPLQVGPTLLKHRVFVSAHSQMYGENGLLSDRHIAYYAERAKGGAALVITEQQGVHWTAKGGYHAMCAGWREESIPRYKQLADEVHAAGGHVFIQGFVAGQQDDGVMFLDNRHAVQAPSPIPSISYRVQPREMTKDDIRSIVEGYGQTAHNAMTAGADGFEIHGAHGYLVCQFFSPLTNHRTDAYGGNTQNRSRFAIEAAEEVRKRVGDKITLGIRLSFDEWIEGGITPEEGEAIVKTLNETGLFDYFNMTGGNYHTMHQTVAPMNVEHGFMVDHARRTKAIVGDAAAVFIVGRIHNIDEASEVIRSGHADMVAMTRAHIADPELINKARSGRKDEIRKCIGANQGCINRVFQNTGIACTVNPTTGLERQWGIGTLQPAQQPRSIAVVGGGPAGMKVAEIAASRGHRVTLFEKADKLGGQLHYAAMLPTRADWSVVGEYLEGALDRHHVDVRLGTEATAERIAALNSDDVVLATGSRYNKDGYSIFRGERPSIPGIERENVLTPVEALDDPDRCGQRVLILDDQGDYPPMGLAEFLADRGKDVEVVSRHMFVGDKTPMQLHLPWIYPRLHEKGIKLSPQRFIESVREGTAIVYNVWDGTQTPVEFDSLILTMLRSSIDGPTALEATGATMHRIGDALTPRTVDDAIYEGYELGRAL